MYRTENKTESTGRESVLITEEFLTPSHLANL